MIQPNELRIGNYVLGKEFNSSEIKPIEVCVIWPSGDNHFYLNPTILDGCIDLWDELIGEVPLTPEILEKCGFQEIKGKQNIFQFGRVQLFGSEIYEAYLKHEDRLEFSYIPTGGIKYLHQLQNLFFALTGEELTVNL